MAASASESDAVGEEIEVIQFRLAGSDYAIRVDETDSIIESKRTARVPRTTDAVEGVMDYRGEVAVIINPYGVLQVEQTEATDRDRIIILDDDVDNQTVGLVSDEVVGVETYPEDALKTDNEAVEGDAETAGELVEGAFALQDEETDETVVVELIDVDALLTEVRESSRLEFQQTK